MNQIISLYKKDKFIVDDDGNQKISYTSHEVFAKVKSVTKLEFYQASNTDLKPSIVFIISLLDYDNERKIEYDGNEYSVLRTYQIDSERIEITCERKLTDD